MTKKYVVIASSLLFLIVGFFTYLLLRNYSNQSTIPSSSEALLLHGYWLSQKGDGPLKLSLRSQLEIQAAAVIYKQYPNLYLVINAGPIWGSHYLSLGTVMKKEIIQLGVPEEKIIFQDNAMDTYDEIVSFLSLAKKYNWTQLVDLAASQHDTSIPTLYTNLNAQATYVTAESILRTYGTQSQKNTVNQLTFSQYEVGLSLYEDFVRIALIVDPNYQLLGAHARSTRNRKTPYGGIPFIPVDKYDLK